MPKKGGKKKGKGKKGKKAEDKGALTEVDKTFYELTITDLNRKLARLRTLTQELELKNEELTEKLAKLDEDRNDVITYLKRLLQEKIDELSEIKESMSKLQESQENEKEECASKIQLMEEEYKQMHEQLTSEIKLLEGKLNSLEEFRVQREELMKKFEMQEHAMEEQENRHKRAMYEIERKFIIAKDKLKKDMETRLLQLSTDFQDATEIRIAATTHRVIRENIAINNELDEMLNVHKRLYTENVNMKQRDRTLQQQTELHSAEKNKALAQNRVQKRVIERMTVEHENMKQELYKFKNLDAEMHSWRIEVQSANLKMGELNNKIRVLEQNLHASRCAINTLQTDNFYYQKEAMRLEDVLFEAVGTIKESLRIVKAQKITDKGVLASKRENLINTLFKLMIVAKDDKIQRPSLPSISSTSGIYKRGDLGFVPQPVPVKRPPLRGIKATESQTGTSLLIDEDYYLMGEGKGEEGDEPKVDFDIEDIAIESPPRSDVFFDDEYVAEEDSLILAGEEEEEDEDDVIGELPPKLSGPMSTADMLTFATASRTSRTSRVVIEDPKDEEVEGEN